MKDIIGIIVEYNPFHNGHLLHINKIKEKYKDSLIIAVMSSSFTMRGDLSIFDKFKKTNHALSNGVDLVIELPFVYSIERSDIFASNAVKILNLLGVNKIIIGSEENNVLLYQEYYPKYDFNIKIPFMANDNLGFFYYKAIKDNNFNIELETIKRIKSNYNDTNITDDVIASASAIRSNINIMEKYVPSNVYKDKDYILDDSLLFNYLKYIILVNDIKTLGNIFLVDEGLEYKLKDIYKFDDCNRFIEHLKETRYKVSRIKRMLLYVLFNITKDMVNNIYKSDINFIRVLGFNNFGKEYLNKIKKNLNIYTNIKEGINDVLDIEFMISKVLDSIYNIDLLKNEQKGPIMR